jgi:spore coat polysaccharide biosynthesis protein SpsF (cytidylyltransferase family)
VTRWFYAGGAGARIVNFAADAARRDVHLAVDTPEHFEFVRQVISAMTRPHWEYGLAGVLELVDRVRAAARPDSGRPSTYLQVRP